MLRPVNTAAISIMAIYTSLWGFWIGNPWWDVFSRAQLYQWMAVLPEWAWGLNAMFVVGGLMLYGVFKPSYRSLQTGATVGFYHWLLIAIFYFGGDWQNTGGITSLMIAVYCAFIHINLKVNRDSLRFDDDPNILVD